MLPIAAQRGAKRYFLRENWARGGISGNMLPIAAHAGKTTAIDANGFRMTQIFRSDLPYTQSEHNILCF